MKLSIIIPSKNEAQGISYVLEHWIKVCEDLDYEIIVVDDSDDDTPEIVRKYSNKYKNIKLIYGERKGVGAARNLGLKYATGEIILYSDADGYPEILEKEIIEAQKKWLKSVLDCFRDDEVDIIISDHKYYFSGNLIQDIETLRQFNTTSMMGECYRKRVLGEISESITVGEDVDLYQKALSRARKIAKTSEPKIVSASVRSIRDIYKRYLWYGRDIWNFLRYHKKQVHRIVIPVLHTSSLLILPLAIFSLYYIVPFSMILFLEYIRHMNRLPIAIKSRKLTIWFLIPFLITFERFIYTVGMVVGIKNLFQKRNK